MPSSKYFHILCTSGDKIVYEGRFQCYSRKAALSLLREKVGRKNLYGLTFTITEFPIDIIREIIESILKRKLLKEGDIIPIDPASPIPADGFASIRDEKRNPHIKKEHLLKKYILPKYSPSELFRIESNPKIRVVYERHGIASAPAIDVIDNRISNRYHEA